jgi:AraC family transcriptional activator of pobA
MSTNLNIKDKSDSSRFLKAAAFRKHTRKTDPHKHNSYFEVIFLSAGKGSHTIDQRAFDVRPPVLFFIRQDQVHHWDLGGASEPEGYVLILKKSFFERSLDRELKQLLTKISSLSCVFLKEQSTIQQLFELVVRENLVESDSSFGVTEALVKALFIKILQLAIPVGESTAHRSGLYMAFTELLTADHPKKNKVAHYAALLNTTPQNLNAVCRKTAGQSATDVLAGYIIDETKRLLAYTDNTITEIAFSLSFKDPSHFVKYFKRYTSYTPQAFRSM